MKYQSTRSSENLGTFSDVLLTGLAPDGGLAVPDHIPTVSFEQLNEWKTLSYQDLALKIMSFFITDIDQDDLKKLIDNSYRFDNFHSNEITPVTQLGSTNCYLLELSNGPSLAFKDIAMQFLGQAFEYVLNKENKRINILGATSGDTGSAAEYAMIGKKNVNVFMLSPYGRMSPFQQAQMYSLDEKNIFNIAIVGVFDDCQDLVKAVNQDENFKSENQIGAVNSINWARILAQTVYYFKAYFSLPIEIGTAVDFSVPSGNFGNVFAGYLAKKMGLPIRRLIVASNENDVLYEFFNTGKYRVRASEQVEKTSSPSMDIGKASNFERYLYYLTGGDNNKVAQWYREINEGKVVDLKKEGYWDEVEKSGFVAGRSSHQNRLATIKQVYETYNRLIDPHTADGVFVAQSFDDGVTPLICLETALPAKFAETVNEATGIIPDRPKRFENIENKEKHFKVMENSIKDLKAYIEKKLVKQSDSE